MSKLYRDELADYGKLVGSSGMTLLQAGKIASPVKSIALALPGGFVAYQFKVFGLVTDHASNVLFAASSDGGQSWYGDDGSPYYGSGLSSESPLVGQDPDGSFENEIGFRARPPSPSGAFIDLTIFTGDMTSFARFAGSVYAQNNFVQNDQSGIAVVISQFRSVDIFIVDGGHGYVVGDVLTIAASNGSADNGRVTVESVNVDGEIVTAHISTLAAGQIPPELPNPLDLQGGSGSGAKANVTYRQQVRYPIDAFKIYPANDAHRLVHGDYRLWGIA